MRPVILGISRAYWAIRFEGIEHIPRNGPLLILSNHVTYADPVILSIPVRRPVHYMAWDRLFHVPGLSWLIRRLRAFPVDIEAADPRATREAVRLLAAGRAVMIFPEAQRSVDGRLGRFRPGAFRLACARAVPVLPATIIGGWESWPPGRVLPRPGRIRIVYHPVLVPPPGVDVRLGARRLLRQVQHAVASALPPHQRPPEAAPHD